MKLKTLASVTLAWSLVAASAAVPPPEKLLPADTIGVITVPDYSKAAAAYSANATSQFWADPAMRPFREKLENKLKEEIIAPLERELGVRFADYNGLTQGQCTFAVVQNGWQGKEDQLPAWLFLIDAKDKTNELKSKLTDLRKKWTDGGKKIKTEKIRDVEFTTLVVSGQDLGKALEKSFPDSKTDKSEKPATADEEKKSAKPMEITLGQSESLLLVGNDPKVIEKVLARQSGGQVPALGEQAAFGADHQTRLRNSLVYGWVHFKPIADVLNRLAADAAKDRDPGDMSPDPTKIMSALGFTGLKTLSFNLNETPDGSFGEFHLGAPAANRAGLFKIVAAEAKDANPPPFVPADAVSFQRWRLDVQKAWNTLESTLVEISPQFGGFFKLMFENVGKDKDPNFDMRRELVGNLGDDLITYQKSPKGKSLAELNSPPSLYLIGSPNAEKLAASLKMLASLLPPGLGSIKEREFLGRKIYSLPLAPPSSADGSAAAQKNLSYAASGGYVAISMDDAILEGYLRSGENTGKTLRET